MGKLVFARFSKRVVCIVAALLVSTVAVLGAAVPASAQQVGPAGQITLNPGGGILANGTDGIRFTINSASAGGNPDAAWAGGDAVVYRNTFQYCCAGGAPYLNIGGTLFGQAGPASSGTFWDSIEVISTSGAATVGTRTSATGNASAVIRYTATKNALTYIMTRTVSYVYPNDYVNDSYTFVIPDGNSDNVKFYLGGDTAPGSSDSGYGIMLTSPVRSVISLNTSSKIMFGFREVNGSKAFDGATSQSYSAPYATVSSGGNIGYVVTSATHDAGLMMQWNLGSTPGTQTASLQEFATQQGTNLNAAFASNSTNINTPVSFSISIVNTELTTVNDLAYSFALPSGLMIGSGSKTNTCNGTMGASTGGTSITLSGGTVGAGTNCVITVPVLSATAGTYAISAASFSGLSETIINNVGASTLTVTDPSLGNDLNGDGTDDSTQANVYSYTSGITDKTVALEVSDACSVSSASSTSEASNTMQDETYTYANGLMDFTLACGTPGFTTTIKQYYYDVPSTGLVLRKYNPNTNTYATIEDATIQQTTIGGHMVTVVSYDVTDGGELDTDGAEDGNITDPAGLAGIAGATTDAGAGLPGAPNSGLPRESMAVYLVAITAGVGLFGVRLLPLRKMYNALGKK